MKYGNLHLHSNHSDGGFRPAHISRLAKSLGYGAVALTDHETISGLPELFEAAKNDGMEVMAGVEFYGTHHGKSPHIVGLDFDPEHPVIVEFTNKYVQWRNECTRAQFEDIVSRGFFGNITWEDIVNYNPISKWYGPDQIFFALDAMGISPITKAGDVRKEAYSGGNVRNIRMQKTTAEELVKTIRAAGGIAILAHPEEYMFENGFLEELITFGLNGIEICHPHITERGAKLACHAAIEYNLYCSGGTDHTGPLSACDGPNAIPAYQGVTLDEYRAIKERRFG